MILQVIHCALPDIPSKPRNAVVVLRRILGIPGCLGYVDKYFCFVRALRVAEYRSDLKLQSRNRKNLLLLTTLQITPLQNRGDLRSEPLFRFGHDHSAKPYIHNSNGKSYLRPCFLHWAYVSEDQKGTGKGDGNMMDVVFKAPFVAAGGLPANCNSRGF